MCGIALLLSLSHIKAYDLNMLLLNGFVCFQTHWSVGWILSYGLGLSLEVTDRPQTSEDASAVCFLLVTICQYPLVM